MLVLTDIHGKASNRRHYVLHCLASCWYAQISCILITNIVASLVLFLKCPHQKFFRFEKKKSIQTIFPPFFGKQTVSRQLFSTLRHYQ